MRREVAEIISFLEDKNSDYSHLWGMEEIFQDATHQKTLATVFSEEQLAIIKGLISLTVKAIEWHDKDDIESHEDIRKELKNIDAKLRNHRHPLEKTASAKPEF
jgi:hypothetical protein